MEEDHEIEKIALELGQQRDDLLAALKSCVGRFNLQQERSPWLIAALSAIARAEGRE